MIITLNTTNIHSLYLDNNYYYCKIQFNKKEKNS